MHYDQQGNELPNYIEPYTPPFETSIKLGDLLPPSRKRGEPRKKSNLAAEAFHDLAVIQNYKTFYDAVLANEERIRLIREAEARQQARWVYKVWAWYRRWYFWLRFKLRGN